MTLSRERIGNYKNKVQKLLNLGFFDNHINEVTNALYKNRIFTKNLICYITNKQFPQSIKSLSQRNKEFIEKEKKRKNVQNNLNIYELNENKESEFNVDIINILKSLHSLDGDLNQKFKELKKENDFFIASFDNYKENNKKIIDKKNKEILLEQSSNYKNNKNFSFDLNSFNSDFFKESPLSISQIDKLKFYYILNRDRNQNKKDNNISNNNELKEPIIWSEEKIKDLKEIKYLKKIGKISKKKMKDNMIRNVNYKEDETDESNNKKFKSFDQCLSKKLNSIKLKKEKKKIQLEIENDKKEIDILKNTIKYTFSKRQNRNEKLSSLRLNYNNNLSFKFNSQKNKDIKRKTFFLDKNNIIPELISDSQIKDFNSTMDKNSLLKSSSFQNIKVGNKPKSKNLSMYSSNSGKNIFQQSTYYSNSTNNKNNLNNINFNNDLKSFSRKEIKNNTIKIEIPNKYFSLKKLSMIGKAKKRNTILTNTKIKFNSFIEEKEKNSTNNIYSICKKLEHGESNDNKKEYMDMLNNYIKSKNKRAINFLNDNNLKSTYTFFRNFKYKLKNEDIKKRFSNLRGTEQSKSINKLKYLDLLDSSIINKEKELLYKVLNRK